ncbi:MAG: histidine phosphatase family protein [Chloroflexota bacterium]|nr:histidine phosphatase family protein [Chloroflexota bacterium]MDE2920768.1 histidine phosphatase family protein [Chloroflexota bacterium]
MSYRDWPLSDEGRRLAARAAEYVAGFNPRLICSSDERKASDTAKIIARHCSLAVNVVPDLREHDRTGVKWRDAATRQQELQALFANPDDVVFGRESGSQALQRLTAAIDRVTTRTFGPWVLVTHGTVMALYLARLTDRAALEIWSQLGLPAVAAVDCRNRRLVELVADFPDRRS